MDDKKMVVEYKYTLTDVACYQYPCARCGKTSVIPQVIVITFGKLAPDGWCCIAQGDSRSYYCPGCSVEIGIA